MVAGSGPNRVLTEEFEGPRFTFDDKSLPVTGEIDLRDNAPLPSLGCLAAVPTAESS